MVTRNHSFPFIITNYYVGNMKNDTFSIGLILIYNFIIMFAIILYWIGYKDYHCDIKDCLENWNISNIN